MHLSEDKLDKVYKEFLKLADKKKEIHDDDILMLAGTDWTRSRHIKVDWLQATSGIGMKPVEYLNLVRVEQACALIRKGEQSIEDICDEVGYQTPSTFNRNFKIVMGVSPSVFKSMKGTATPLRMFKISTKEGWEGYHFLPTE